MFVIQSLIVIITNMDNACFQVDTKICAAGIFRAAVGGGRRIIPGAWPGRAEGRVESMNPDQVRETVKDRYDKFASQGGSKESC